MGKPLDGKGLKRATYNLRKLLFTNPRSIVSKINELDEIIKLNNISLICITESWLTGNIPESCVTLEGFTTDRSDREGRKGGGICAWIKTDTTSSEVSRHLCDDYESLWLRARPARLPRALLIRVIYLKTKTYWKAYSQYYWQLSSKTSRCWTYHYRRF